MIATVDPGLSEDLLDVATSAAAAVGPYLRERFAAGVSAEHKADRHDLVTASDREAEDMIAEHILRRHPDSRVLGEERGWRGNGTVRWYVDPIDGTNNFAHRIPFFCVAIGAELDGEVVAGAIYDPIRDELFSASARGAFLNGTPIASSGHASDAGALLLTDFPRPASVPSPSEYELFARLVTSFAVVRRLGSGALGLAYVACGRADASYQTHASPWDLAAGVLLVSRAGGQCVPVVDGNHEPPPAAPWMHTRLVAACRELVLAGSSLSAVLSSAA